MPTSYGAVIDGGDDAGVATIAAGPDSAGEGIDKLLGPPPPPPEPLPPATPAQRVALLTSAILFTSGSHFARHALSSLTPTLTTTLTLSATSMAALFSAQELPGIVLPLTAATLLTLGPPSLVAASAAVVSTVGQVAAAAAVGAGSYGWLLAARLAFGAADSVLIVAMGSLIAEGFHSGVRRGGGYPRRRRGLARVSDSGGLYPASSSADGGDGSGGGGGVDGSSSTASGQGAKPLLGVSLAYGLMLLASRGSTFFSMWAPAAIGRACGGDACALWVTAGVSTSSLVGAALYVAVEWDRHRRARRAAADVEADPTRLRSAGGDVRVAAACALEGPPPLSSRVSPTVAAPPPPPPLSDGVDRPAPVRWAATLLATTRALPLAFWHLAVIWALLASALFPLLHAAGAIFASSFPAAWPAGLSPAAASAVPSVVVGAAAAASPLVGATVGRRGGRERVLVAACLAMAGGLAVLSVLATLPAPAVQGDGVADVAGLFSWRGVPAAKVAAVAGLLAIVTAFGAAPVTLLSSVAVAVPPHAGGLKDWSGSYAPPLAFWAALAAAGALVAHRLACLHVPALSAPDDVNLTLSPARRTH